MLSASYACFGTKRRVPKHRHDKAVICQLSAISKLAIVLFTVLALSVPALGDIAADIDKLLTEPALKHGTVGALVVSLRDGRTIYSRNADKAFVPASNMKLLTTSAALDALGPDYRYKTTFCLTGKTTGSVHKGDLYIRGGGDPVMKTEHLEKMSRMLKQNGIRTIEGAAIADEGRFGQATLGFGWTWDDEPWYYAAPFGALNLNGNAVGVLVKPGPREGSPAVVRIDPPTGYLVVRSAATTGAIKAGSSIVIDRQHGRRVITVSGQVALNHKADSPLERVSVPDPALYAATSLKEALRREGISVRGDPTVGAVSSTAKVIATHLSPPLSEILALINKPSDNLIAEVLFHTLGVESGKSASEDDSRAAEMAFLKKIGGDTGAVVIADGSGLSRRNFISPQNIVAMLTHNWRSPNSKVFLDSLPIAGKDGTLKNRMKGTNAEGVVRAKTGYLSNVSSLSGYATTSAGEGLVFCFLMNNHLCKNADAKAVQDRICQVLCQ